MGDIRLCILSLKLGRIDMKSIKKLSNTMFDAASGFILIPIFAALFFGPMIIALIVWAVRLVKRAKEKARIARANEERQAKN